MENNSNSSYFAELKILFERITELEKELLDVKFENESLKYNLRYTAAFAENNAFAYPEIV